MKNTPQLQAKTIETGSVLIFNVRHHKPRLHQNLVLNLLKEYNFTFSELLAYSKNNRLSVGASENTTFNNTFWRNISSNTNISFKNIYLSDICSKIFTSKKSFS